MTKSLQKMPPDEINKELNDSSIMNANQQSFIERGVYLITVKSFLLSYKFGRRGSDVDIRHLSKHNILI